jgi:GDP/UDP-N,N'-diacetylbacillosamine 2-epimerase (hydrolysing)
MSLCGERMRYNHMRILYLTGARSDYGLMRRTLLAMHATYDLSIAVTGMHLEREFGYTVQHIVKDKLPIWKRIKLPYSQHTVAHMWKNEKYLEDALDALLAKKSFDLCFVEGDRYEALAMARVAKKHAIPIMHQGGGDKSGGIDDTIRSKITELATIHLPGNLASAARLRKRGIPKNKIHMFGEPGLDAIAARDFTPRKVLEKRYRIHPKNKLLLVTMHPDTTSSMSARKQIIPVLDAVKALALPTVIIYPNSDAGAAEMIQEIRNVRSLPFVQIHSSLPHRDFLSMLARCDVMLGNSSAGLVETTIAGTPFVNVGGRQRGRLADGNVTTVPVVATKIIAAVKKNLDRKGTFKLKHVYGAGDFTQQCMKLLRIYERNR